MLNSASTFVADNLISGHTTELKTVLAAFIVGTIVGITGMGGGALMTPALIFLGVGDASAVVTADLTSAAVYKSAGAIVHWREGSPNLQLAGWLIIGSVPFAFLGPFLVRWLAPGSDIDTTLKRLIGIALLLAASTYAARLYIQLKRVTGDEKVATGDPVIRPIPTVIVGAVGGLLVGITSVGSGSVIMIALLMLYPTLTAVKLVGTDLVQAVPLVFAAAVSNIIANGLEWNILIPLLIGSVPGSILGSKIAPRVPSSTIRRGIVVVLTVSGLALIDKAGWWPTGNGPDGETTHPVTIVVIGLVILLLLPFVWGLLRRREGLPMFGQPTVSDIEAPAGTPASRRAKRLARKAMTENAQAESPDGAPASPGGQPSGQPGGQPGGPAKKAAAGRPAKKAAAGQPAKKAAAEKTAKKAARKAAPAGDGGSQAGSTPPADGPVGRPAPIPAVVQGPDETDVIDPRPVGR